MTSQRQRLKPNTDEVVKTGYVAMSWVPVAACLPLPRALTGSTILETNNVLRALARADKPPMPPKTYVHEIYDG